MIVILDCYYKLSSNKLYQVSKILGHRRLRRLVEPANKLYLLARKIYYRLSFLSVQLIQAAIIQTTLTMMKIDHILFILLSISCRPKKIITLKNIVIVISLACFPVQHLYLLSAAHIDGVPS